MIELIKSKEINIPALRKEKSEYITEQILEFQLNEMILKLVEQDERKSKITKIYVSRTIKNQVIEFSHILDEKGNQKTIRCSNVEIIIET